MVRAVVMDNLLVEVRFVADDFTRQSPGRLTGTLVRYGEKARNLAERFADGALALAGQRPCNQSAAQPRNDNHPRIPLR